MTKKDFEVIAIALRRSRPPRDRMSGIEGDQWLKTRDAFLQLLPLTNSRFDEARFIRACEVPPSE